MTLREEVSLGFIADDQEPFAVGSDIPADGPGADSGIHHLRIEERLRGSGMERLGLVLTGTAIMVQSGEM